MTSWPLHHSHPGLPGQGARPPRRGPSSAAKPAKTQSTGKRTAEARNAQYASAGAGEGLPVATAARDVWVHMLLHGVLGLPQAGGVLEGRVRCRSDGSPGRSRYGQARPVSRPPIHAVADPPSCGNTRFLLTAPEPTVWVTGTERRPKESVIPGNAGGSDEGNSEDATAVKDPGGRENDDDRHPRPG